MTPAETGAAFDLGLTEKARDHFKRRLMLLFREGCAIFGPAAAAKLFREQAREGPKELRFAKTMPPRKRKGPHDPESDKYLVQLWMAGHWESKHHFARHALKNQSVKVRKKIVGKVIGKNRDQDEREVKSIIRRLDRAIQRRSALRQIGPQKAKA